MSSNGHHDFVPTDEQRQAIEHIHGPMLVVAGAGTGKTTVLARRIAHLIQSNAARADEILAVTYTRNSAAELIDRVGAILYPRQQASLYPEIDRQRGARKLLSSGLQAHTFHGYCYKLLHDAGTTFELLDDKDLFVLLRRRIGDMKLQHYIKAAAPGKFLEDLLKFFSSCHDELRTPDDYDDYVAKLERRELPLPRMAKRKDAAAMPDDEVLARCREVARAFRFAEELLKQEGLGTFGHIMTRAVDLLARRKPVLERAQRRARFILIDEFQDSNLAQIRLASLLAGEEANVFAVGDPDQAIYQFRGATSGAFDQFLETFGPERVRRVTMTANRRSTLPILRCAYLAIQCESRDCKRGQELVAPAPELRSAGARAAACQGPARAGGRALRCGARSRLRCGDHRDDAERRSGARAEADCRALSQSLSSRNDRGGVDPPRRSRPRQGR